MISRRILDSSPLPPEFLSGHLDESRSAGAASFFQRVVAKRATFVLSFPWQLFTRLHGIHSCSEDILIEEATGAAARQTPRLWERLDCSPSTVYLAQINGGTKEHEIHSIQSHYVGIIWRQKRRSAARRQSHVRGMPWTDGCCRGFFSAGPPGCAGDG
jgi:hypothetical protein